MKIVVIDGQGGRMGALLCEKIKKTSQNFPSGTELVAIGTNSAATAAMLKAGADCGATGENPVLVACRDADFIIGPLGIMAADSLLGEFWGKSLPPWLSPWEAARRRRSCFRSTAATTMWWGCRIIPWRG